MSHTRTFNYCIRKIQFPQIQQFVYTKICSCDTTRAPFTIDGRSGEIQSSAATPIFDKCSFKLAPDISFIDPNDRELIERIITLGFYYRELEQFSSKSRNLNWIRYENATLLENKEKPSVYRKAISNGIIEILSVYTSLILHIEQLLLGETMPILVTVTQWVNNFFTLFPPLYELILEIKRNDIPRD
ncbi:hypothetical protein RYX36_032264 [Vicia faba]